MTPPSLFTIAISGSRRLSDRSIIFPELDRVIIDLFSPDIPPESIHFHLGDAQGVDATAIYWCRARGIGLRTVFFASPAHFRCFTPEANESIVQSADWDLEGHAAGPKRNLAMLLGSGCPTAGCDGADLLLALRSPAGPNRNRGTDDCRYKAGQLGIRTMTYTVGSGWSN